MHQEQNTSVKCLRKRKEDREEELMSALHEGEVEGRMKCETSGALLLSFFLRGKTVVVI